MDGEEKWGTEGAQLVRMRVGREKENHPRLQRMVKDRMVGLKKKKCCHISKGMALRLL